MVLLSDAAWRSRLRTASFKGVEFKYDVVARSGGRRINPNEFPYRDTPDTEDLGRRIRRFQVTGYLVGPDVLDQRDDLIEALESEGPGTLVHPTGGEYQVNAGDHASIERRERGGVVEFEMQFVEAGQDGGTAATADTQSRVETSATNLQSTASSNLDETIST